MVNNILDLRAISKFIEVIEQFHLLVAYNSLTFFRARHPVAGFLEQKETTALILELQMIIIANLSVCLVKTALSYSS